MLESERITYEPQFLNSGTDTARPFLKGPAVACRPDGTFSLGQGLVIEALGVDEMRIGLLKVPLLGDAFGGKRVTDSNGQLISWSVFLIPVIDDSSRVVLGEALSSVSDARKRRKLQSEIRNSLPHLIVDPEEGIYLQLKNDNRLELTEDGVVLRERNGDDHEDHDVEEGSSICMPANKFIDPEIAPILSEGEIEVQLDYSGTPDEILRAIRVLLEETDFSSEEERLYLELELREIINPVVRIYPE